MKSTVISSENKSNDLAVHTPVAFKKVGSAKGLQPSKAFDSVQTEVIQSESPQVVADAVVQDFSVPATARPVLNLEQTLKLVAELAKKTAQRDRYHGYIDMLKAFVVSQHDEDDMAPNDTSFKGCELMIKDGQGHVFRTDSAAVISGTIDFMARRFNERLAEVEAEIVIPA